MAPSARTSPAQKDSSLGAGLIAAKRLDTGRREKMTPTQEKELRENDAVVRSPFVPRGRMPDPFTLVMFGATGDLAARKLFPAVFALAREQFLPADFIVVGIGRRGKDDVAFHEDVRRSLAAAHADAPREEVDGFLDRVFYHRGDFTTAEGLAGLGRRLGELEGAHGLPGNNGPSIRTLIFTLLDASNAFSLTPCAPICGTWIIKAKAVSMMVSAR